MGHTSRSISIGRELIYSGHEVHFAAYGYSREIIMHKNFITHEIPPEITIVGQEGYLDINKTILATFKNWEYKPSRWGLVQLRKLLMKIDPDLVTSDSYFMGVLSFAVPMISIPDQNHSEQQNNSSVIEEDGLGKRLEYSPSSEDILENIKLLMDDEKYRNKLMEMRELAEKLEGPMALRKMLEEISKNKNYDTYMLE